jgi:hypothetical protein
VLEAPEAQFGLYEAGGLDVSFAEIASAVEEIVPGARTTFGTDDTQVLPNLIDWSRIRTEFGAVHRELRAGMESVIEFERGRQAAGVSE